MKCPVCKYDNKQGATHCGMCYEVFNRSAAQNYLHAVKRGKIQDEKPLKEPEAVIRSQRIVEQAGAVLGKVDWAGFTQEVVSFIKRFQKELLIGAGAVALWIVVSFLFSADLWYHLFGKKFVYALPGGAPTTYLVGMNQSVRVWSERGGRLDTPMEQYNIEEIGNVALNQKRSTSKKRKTILVTAREWIQILNDASGSTSHSIPKKHPSLAGGRLIFDHRGALLERTAAPSARVGKSLPFLAPRFPEGTLRRGLTWDEAIEWTDVYNDWQIDWAGTLHWTLGELSPCREGTCAKLTYIADLRPRLRGSPAWAQGAVHRAEATAATDGDALFDVSNHQLISNTFSYEGMLRIPITDLGRIPWELRIGRRVKGAAGEIILRYINKIDIRKN